MDDQTTPQKPARAPKAADEAASSWHETLPVPAPSPAPGPTSFLLADDAFAGAVQNDNAARYRSAQAHPSSAWIKGPGAVTLLVEAGHGLNKVAALRKMPETHVAYVRTLALPAVKALLVWPTTEEDLDKVEVSWRNGHASFTASDVLIRAKIPVESGRKMRFEAYVAAESKVGPVLVIDMRYVKDVKVLTGGSSSKDGATDDDDLDLEDEE